MTFLKFALGQSKISMPEGITPKIQYSSMHGLYLLIMLQYVVTSAHSTGCYKQSSRCTWSGFMSAGSSMYGVCKCKRCNGISMLLAWASSGPDSHWHMIINAKWPIVMLITCHAMRHGAPVPIFSKDSSCSRYANSHAGTVYCACYS